VSDIAPVLSQQAHRRAAFVVSSVLVLVAVGISPFLSVTLPAIAPFLPAYGTAVILLESITAYLLLSQFATARKVFPGFVASAYLSLIPMVIVQQLVFPGVFTPTGLLNAGSQSAVWIWVFWHGLFPALMLLACFAERFIKIEQVDYKDLKLWLLGFVAAPLCLSLSLALFAAWGSHILPALIANNSYQQLVHSPYALVVWAMNAVALSVMLLRARSNNVLYIWLSVALLASLIDVSLTLFAGARFSLGWYAARISSCVSSMVLLGALLWEVNRLYISTQRANEQLYQQSVRDTLTGLFNRRYLESKLETLIEHAKRYNEPLCLLVLDVDYFKDFNDRYGHLAGDSCLVAVAQQLEQGLHRPADFIARYGGEEFVVVLPYTDAKGGGKVAEQLRQSISQAHVDYEGQQLSITASIGLAVLQCDDSALSLLVAADKALYQAKAAGRNCVKVALRDQ
jgi:diguanylate cyclase (GGDEF)-like protein